VRDAPQGRKKSCIISTGGSGLPESDIQKREWIYLFEIGKKGGGGKRSYEKKEEDISLEERESHCRRKEKRKEKKKKKL